MSACKTGGPLCLVFSRFFIFIFLHLSHLSSAFYSGCGGVACCARLSFAIALLAAALASSNKPSLHFGMFFFQIISEFSSCFRPLPVLRFKHFYDLYNVGIFYSFDPMK